MHKSIVLLCLFFISARADEPLPVESYHREVFFDALNALNDTIKKRDELRLRLLALDLKGRRMDSDEKGVEKLKEMLAQKVPFTDGDFLKKLHKLALKLDVEEAKGKILDSQYWYLDKSTVGTTLLCVVGVLVSAGIIQKNCDALREINIAKILAALVKAANGKKDQN